jgi:hypothetical protein
MLAPQADLRYEDGVAYLDTDLVGPDNFGHPVTIALACTAHPGERVDPRRALTPGCTLRAAWTSLPGQLLCDRYLPPAPPLVTLQPELAARVRWERFTWPEVPLTLVGDSGAFPARTAGIVGETLESTAGAWNRAHAERPIKYVGSPRSWEDGSAIEAFVDFGPAPVEAMAEMLRALVATIPLLRSIQIGRASADTQV